MPHFGFSDASDETNLNRYFVRSALYDQIKKGKKESGVFVIHGVKGSGKTAICNMIQTESAQSLVLKIDKTFGFDVRHIDAGASAIEGLMATLLLKELINSIKEDNSHFSPKALQRVNASSAKFKSFISKIPSAVKIKAGPLELDPSKLAADDVARFSRFDIGAYVDSLTLALKERQAYILLDDMDDVFAGADRNADFVEGLIRAAKEINKAFRSLIHCLVFLKSGVFDLYFENAKEYDKVRDYISPPISWGKDELTSLLAVRIRDRFNKGIIDDTTAWALDFDTKDGIEKIQDYIISRCVSGPRDLIVYCNMAKDKAGNAKITMKDVEAVDDLYSKEKLATLNRDFGRTYPRINDFLQQLFSGEKQVYTNEDLTKLLTDKAIADERIQQIFKDANYVRFATKERLIELLYSIGFIGFRRTKSASLEFVITTPDPGSQVLYKAYEYRIHHAYKHYLNLKD